MIGICCKALEEGLAGVNGQGAGLHSLEVTSKNTLLTRIAGFYLRRERKRGKGDWGQMIRFCPFCGTNLEDRHRRSIAEHAQIIEKRNATGAYDPLLYQAYRLVAARAMDLTNWHATHAPKDMPQPFIDLSIAVANDAFNGAEEIMNLRSAAALDATQPPQARIAASNLGRWCRECETPAPAHMPGCSKPLPSDPVIHCPMGHASRKHMWEPSPKDVTQLACPAPDCGLAPMDSDDDIPF